eukprot:TRINITY_DN38915_c0_g1_i1.p1 TRINITY_DN38915_c0_g1~~TRINITY_DN38915_c0_g1_i1.p1  ORF type:complete len:148 (+),score=40.10 TRINITY_DN38915_c0_g1_i1:69-512(+)
MSDTLSDQQKNEFKEAFGYFDKNSNGTIASSELGRVMRCLGATPTDAQVSEIISNLKNAETIDLETFLTIMAEYRIEDDSIEEIREAFSVFDNDGSGTIAAAELKYMLTNLGERLSEQEVEEFMKGAGVDGEGMVEYEKFIDWIVTK